MAGFLNVNSWIASQLGIITHVLVNPEVNIVTVSCFPARFLWRGGR
jgi:hypothetical protein